MFYFDLNEWKRLFPLEIVEWMIDHAPHGPHLVVSQHDQRRVLTALPEMGELPVLVAVRMSLSFPILLSAVPLYAVDFSLKENQHHDARPLLAEHCWFSDGGICSNFPIHFFDSPLPRWPTFGIDLQERQPEHPEPVWMPKSDHDGVLARWNRFDEQNPLHFLFAILSAAQNWRDALQMRLPGFRDRIVHIRLTKEQGGLNLNMKKSTIKRLVCFGQQAAQKILTVFNQDHHIWGRYRSTMSGLQTYGARFVKAYDYPVPQDSAIWPPIKSNHSPVQPPYPMTAALHDWAVDETRALVDMAKRWNASKPNFSDGAPHPEPELRAMPKT